MITSLFFHGRGGRACDFVFSLVKAESFVCTKNCTSSHVARLRVHEKWYSCEMVDLDYQSETELGQYHPHGANNHPPFLPIFDFSGYAERIDLCRFVSIRAVRTQTSLRALPFTAS